MNVPQTEVNLRSFRVLLAEDSPIHRHVAVKLLRNQGHRVTIVCNGREVLEALRRENYDVVLMDIEMPELDGLTTTRMIRHLESSGQVRLPIVAVTSTDMRDACYNAGMDAFLSKPLSAGLLERTLKRVAPKSAV